MTQRTYSDAEVASALATLAMNGGNVKRTSDALSIPRTTLIDWRDAAVTAAPRDTADTKTDTPASVLAEQPHDFAGMWGEVQRIATARMLVLLPTATDLKAVAVAAGIAADKHLDYAQGRKGATVNVDARTQTQNIHVDSIVASIVQARTPQQPPVIEQP